jgi:membrane protein
MSGSQIIRVRSEGPFVCESVLNKLKKAPGIQLLKSKPVILLVQTALKWQRDECWEIGCSVVLLRLFSLFPIFLVVLSVFGAFIGPTSQVYDQVIRLSQNSLPPEAYALVNEHPDPPQPQQC